MTTTTFFRKVLTATAVGVASFSFAQTQNYDLEQDGIYYKVINETSVEIVALNDGYGFGEVIPIASYLVIPSQIEYEGKTYDVTKIGRGAFQRRIELVSVSIPDTVTEIGDNAFEQCKRLETVVLPKKIKKISNSTFFYCENLKNISLPNEITQIESSAFRNCKSLKEIVIPNGVTEIGKTTFDGCSSLTKITLPERLEKIGYFSFQGLYSLKEIISKNWVPPTIDSKSFPNTPQDGVWTGKTEVSVRVPVGSKALYETTDWKYFNIVEDATLSTTENKANTSVSAKVYPNPTTGIFFIETETPTTAQIVSITGQNIKSVKLNKGKNQVDISNVVSGLYFVKIGNTTAKVIKK